MFIILKQTVDAIKVERDASMDDEEYIIGMESDVFCVPQECEPEVSHILMYIFVVVVFYVYFCVWFGTYGTAEIG